MNPTNQPKSSSSSPNNIDSLFQSIAAQQISESSSTLTSNSAPATPTVATNEDNGPAGSTSAASAAERQSALLSLLYPAAGSNPVPPSSQPPSMSAPPAPQQVPTPPTSSQRTGQSPSNSSEAQGKFLLEQLMTGAAPRSNYSESAPSAPTMPPVSSAPLLPQATEPYLPAEGPRVQQETTRDLPQLMPLPQAQQPAPSSPPRPMFDFVSPFDAFGSTAAPAVKKKPVPAGPPSSSSGNDDSWTSASLGSLGVDSKRKSVENLIDQLTRGQGPYGPGQPPSPSYDPYNTADEYSQVEPNQPISQQQRIAPPPPLPPKPAPPPPLPPKPGRASPRASPPKPLVQPMQPHQQHRPQGRSTESPVGQPAPPSRKDKDGSPGPRPTWKNDNRAKGGVKGKAQTSPPAQPQTIIFDVSQLLEEVQAPRDNVKSTAIALVKQDFVFLPGTTIGATHWIAYAMTRGRVRVISRSSGDRTLLQLPTVFAPSTQVVDMAVYGNRLAGVTSDGGFVVWELPEVITDDVPGRLLLCVVPSADADPLHSVKWHPKQPDTLAVASETKMYLLDLAEAARTYRGEPLPQIELNRISQVFTVPSRLVAFDFDVPHFALATISEDSTLTLWNVHDKLPFWTHRVRGEDVPSSLTFIDDDIVIGRKNGTVFQLLSVISKNVLSTLKFVNGTKEDLDMFGHVNYDSRIQTLWVANSRRDSLIAVKIGFDVSASPSGDVVRGGFFEQVIEFSGPKPTIHFVILSADADPTGEEAHAACIAAKVPPGELALVAFSVHSTGVDQVLVRKEWYDNALNNAISKFPTYAHPQVPAPGPVDIKPTRHVMQGPPNVGPLPQQPAPVPPQARLRTPPSEELDSEMARDEVRAVEAKGKNAKGKNVAFRDRDEREKNKVDAGALSDSGVVQLVAKEIKKSEENLHNRIGRLIGKEMDKQNARFEEARAHEQAEDFNRQEKILKLISTELTRNTTRVVEMAVKAEVQSSDILREMRTEILNVKKDSMTWQTEAARSQEALIRELEHSVRVLSDQVKFLTMNASNLSTVHHRVVGGGSPVPSVASMTSIAAQPLHRQQLPATQSAAYSTQAAAPSYSQATQAASIHGPWYSPTLAAPQASHPIAPPPPPPAPASQRSPPTHPQPEEWDDKYLSVLSTQDPKQLRELLAQSNPEVIMPLKGPGPLSQAVVLTLLHRLAATVGETPPVDEAFKSALWWLQRAATVLNINEPLISPYVARVVPSVRAMLNTTKQRLSILPGPPQLMDSVRMISDIQDTLTRKQT
ncbi:hypothetical protein PISMIDRAFT_97707 [Pisolithus microcarpus 441]|uniref:Enhancer of mRNA-decapping protein 4 n=1 Tax=Pisolithus microcarpus 441 TaxID=765257 RepID=A0A0C9ZRU8_9AGAM|nr:hypothetical protein PISMIDRAFT_97707 [Pisolithus microcarpus 441]